MVSILEKLQNRTATVGVVGLGYVGLPLAVGFASAGLHVIGVDVDKRRVAQLNDGSSHVLDVSDEEVGHVVRSGRFRATTDYKELAVADAIVICVPTPLRKSKDPDISYITDAVSRVREIFRPGMLLVLESTTYPGTTDELIGQEFEAAGFVPGRDYYLCFSPERVDPSNRVYGLRNTPKIVGGATPACLNAGVALYSLVAERVVPVSSTRVAEMAKLLENTFRAVNIGLVNEIALLCDRMGIDVWEVIDAAATKPFGFMPFYPGPGIGGHCIPLDPAYLSWKAKMFDFYQKFIELASDINGNMPRYTVERIADVLNTRCKSIKGSRILILGMAYKKDIDDVRESPALEVFHLLEAKGAEVEFNDPYVSAVRIGNGIKESVPLTAERLRAYDLVVLTTNHSTYDYAWIAEHASLIFDTRNGFRQVKSDKIFRLGAPYPGGTVQANAVVGGRDGHA
jgi:UDP-N-acetyl-D-glucosamine dehydrogenase